MCSGGLYPKDRTILQCVPDARFQGHADITQAFEDVRFWH